MNKLKTYLQISDLHFCGWLQRKTADPWAKYIPLLNGYVGHSHGALMYLTKTLKQLKKVEPDLELVVTGDLTAFGNPGQFRIADNFLSTAGKRPGFLGLNTPGWKTLAISGNHDYWPGFPFPLGGTNTAVRTYFPNDWAITPSTVSLR